MASCAYRRLSLTLSPHSCILFIDTIFLFFLLSSVTQGGILALTDTPQEDLGNYRGFFEPYKAEWREFDAPAFLRGAGFSDFGEAEFLGYKEDNFSGDGELGEGTYNRLFSHLAIRGGTSRL